MHRPFRPFAILALLLAGMVGFNLYLSGTFERSAVLNALRNRYYIPDPEFKPLLRRFRQLESLYNADPEALPIVYKDYFTLQEGSYSYQKIHYTIRLAPKALGLPKSQVVLANPFGPERFPLSFSVLYQGHLLTLFRPGYFACYTTDSLRRNQALERRLNTRRFRYHWLINDQLIGLSGTRYFVFSPTGRWEPLRQPLPLSRQPKLFEDKRYLAWMTCNGEWGGEVYFYDKQRRIYYLARATCPNSIIKHNGSYFVLSSLGHMLGSCDWQQIDDPTRLTRWQGPTRPQDRDFTNDRENAIRSGKTLFDYQQMEMLSAFVLNGEPMFMVNWRGSTLLATWQNDVFTIVDPLFNDGLYTHTPVTTTYGPGRVLMNINAGDNVESACILLADRQLVKINWHPDQVSEPTMMLNDTVWSPLETYAPAVTDSAEAVSEP
ncbi:hypothetical protein LGH70_05560 [Hymenobacter sp. BT635]|uniref:Uncharacterized protein n=1 Tax=Hymenobacter nitidus TaxID=2880929 RepID=A0ABS8A9G8_9BACT|nr:hypothetical protein [Hymenobacter nitidus]MCB2377038.1 hypothetical protein [Hymenobacter nitidus]